MASTTLPSGSAKPLSQEGIPRGPFERGSSHSSLGPWLVSTFFLCLAIGLAYLPAWSGLVNLNPALIFSGLGAHLHPGFLPGYPTIDPNEGFITQALGHLVAMDWLHGRVPWWNPFEALGTPLAGEIQSAALYPPVLVLALPGASGVVLFHALGELIAGLATIALLRKLGLNWVVATSGGIAFALSGTYAWLTNAIQNPICFLPLSLLAIEIMLNKAKQGQRGGWWLLAIALAGSLYAGFPEVAYMDGLLVALWLVVRVVQLAHEDLTAAKKLLTGALTGVLSGILLSLPFLLPAFDYLKAGRAVVLLSQFQRATLPPRTEIGFFMPFIFGPIFDTHKLASLQGFWSSTGGFVTVAETGLAVFALTARPKDPLRWALAGFVLVGAMKIWGPGPLIDVINLVPGMRIVAAYRYFQPSMEMCVLVLAALGAGDLHRRGLGARTLLSAVLCALGLGLGILEASHILASLRLASKHEQTYQALSLLFGVCSLGLVGLVGFLPIKRWRTLVASTLIVIPAFTWFLVPELSAPKTATADTTAVRYLARHEKLSRVYAFGVLQPNYGSEYKVQELDINDAPTPKLLHTYIRQHLDPNTIAGVFNGANVANPSGMTPLQAFLHYEPNYARTGVKWILTPPTPDFFTKDWPSKDGPAPKLILRTSSAYLYELPNGKGFYSTKTARKASGGCTLTHERFSSLEAACTTNVLLVRREQYMPGWSASVNGHQVAIHPYDSLMQEIVLPKGTSRISFSFTPPHLDLALGGLLVGLLMLSGAVLQATRRRDHLARGT